MIRDGSDVFTDAQKLAATSALGNAAAPGRRVSSSRGRHTVWAPQAFAVLVTKVARLIIRT